MSFTIQIQDGDIALHGNTFAVTDGIEKLKQDLTTWLKERYRSDRFHTSYGSILDGFIGGVVSQNVLFEIETEVNRVLQNYQALQYRRYKSDPQSLTPSEILAEINNVTATASYDRVTVAVDFTTYLGTTAVFTVSADVN